MKEKIGIEKLIELLNEYENKDLELEEGEESNARTENNGHLWFNGANKVQFDTYMFDNLALSKRYGFIKWLVENDKIDLDHLEYKYQDVMYELLESLIIENKSDFLIMLLSIQEQPIRFLCEILK